MGCPESDLSNEALRDGRIIESQADTFCGPCCFFQSSRRNWHEPISVSRMGYLTLCQVCSAYPVEEVVCHCLKVTIEG